jgi:hypothetical protein
MKVVGGIAGAMLVVLLAIFILPGLINTDDADDAKPRSVITLGPNDGPPREFLYLDGARVDAYVSQLEGGLATIQKTSATAIDKRSAEISAAPSKASREVQAQDAFERSVTPTTTSRFTSLVTYLKDRHDLKTLPRLAALEKTSERAHARADAFLRAWTGASQGTFVQISAPVKVPSFGRLYQAISLVPPKSAAGRQGKKLLAAVGPDPRFPISVEVDSTDGVPLRLILPLQYSLLGSEASLLGGSVTVIGKVLYRIHPKRRPFRDTQTWSRFRPVIRRADTPDRLLKRFGLQRGSVRRELERYKTVKGPAAVILPVAIYK